MSSNVIAELSAASGLDLEEPLESIVEKIMEIQDLGSTVPIPLALLMVIKADVEGIEIKSHVDEKGVRTIRMPRKRDDTSSQSAFSSLGAPSSVSSPATSRSTLFPSMISPLPALPGLKILCLDGGGVRGLSICFILQELLVHLKARGIPAYTRPCEVFDLICGTSTGGLIALLFGPLKMTVPQVIEIYKKGAKKIFGTPLIVKLLRSVLDGAKLSTKTFNKFIRGVLWDATGDMTIKMNSGNPDDCKVFVVAVDYYAMNKCIPLILRTYDSPRGRADTCTIHQAARATSAAPNLFTSQYVYGKRWIDGSSGHNNPALLAQSEAERLWPDRRIDAIVSIGTGTWRDISAKNPKRACVTQTTGSHSVHSSMEELTETAGNYFRFDVPELGSDVDVGAWQKMGYVEERTKEYLDSEEIQALLKHCALTFEIRS